jgi:xylulokinase
MPLFLGLDAGTSGTKAVITDETGMILATHTEEYPLSTPHPQWAEQHPDNDWWRAALVAIPAVLHKAGVSGEQIGGVGLTGQMHGSVFLDAQGKVLRPALLWCDARTGIECAEITQAVGGTEKLYATIGQPIFTSFTAPKIVWLKKHEPELYDQVAQVLLPKDYIRYKLTGEYATEVSDASGTSLLDVRARNWSDAMLSTLQIPKEWLPKVYESPEITGVISEEAAKLTGLRAGTPVVGGGGDQAAGAVGCGIVETGNVSLSLGTSGVVFAHLDEPFFAPEKIQTFCHAVPGKWHLMGCIISAAGAFEWYKETFAPTDSYDTITAQAGTAPVGCEGLLFLPYLAGERNPYFDPNARGVFFGATLRSQKHWFARAVLEGVSYAFNDLFQLMREAEIFPDGKISGVPAGEIRAIGGGVKSALWRQIIADVLQKSLWQVNIEEGPAYGAAVLAMVGTGAYSSVPEACRATIRPTTETVPNPATGATYSRYYPLYRSLYPLLKESFGQVAEISQ